MIGHVTRRRCSCPRGGGGAVGAADVNVGMSTVALSVQRRTSGGSAFLSIPAGGVVMPGEAVRLFASGVALLGVARNSIDFAVFNADGERIDGANVGTNLEGHAWYDTVVPRGPGAYSARATYLTLIGRSSISFPFRVGADAPPLPKAPPQGGPGGAVGGVLGDFKTIGWIVLGIVGLSVASSLAKK